MGNQWYEWCLTFGCVLYFQVALRLKQNGFSGCSAGDTVPYIICSQQVLQGVPFLFRDAYLIYYFVFGSLTVLFSALTLDATS